MASYRVKEKKAIKLQKNSYIGRIDLKTAKIWQAVSEAWSVNHPVREDN